MQATDTVHRQPATTARRGTAAGFVVLCAATATVGALVPNHLVAPMGRMTHFMALAGPENPAAPGPALWLFSPMAVVYGLVLTSLVATWLPPGAGRLGVALLGPLTASIAGHLVRWLVVPLTPGGWVGPVDWFSTVAYAAAAVPLAAAGWHLARTGEVRAGLVVAGGILLHAGMLPGMLPADLLGGDLGGHGMALVRWG